MYYSIGRSSMVQGRATALFWILKFSLSWKSGFPYSELSPIQNAALEKETICISATNLFRN